MKRHSKPEMRSRRENARVIQGEMSKNKRGNILTFSVEVLTTDLPK